MLLYFINRVVFSRRGATKVIHLLGSYETSYFIDINDHNVTRNVMFLSQEKDPPLAKFAATTLTVGIRQLNISGLKVSGNIHISAEGHTFSLHLSDIRASYGRTVLNITRCGQLTATVAWSDFTDTLLALSSEGTTNVTFVRSNFRGVTPMNATKNFNVGITVAFPKRGGKHVIRLHRCLFENLQQNFGTEFPAAAFSLLAAREKTKVKVYVVDSTFLTNYRAIDLSLKGDVFVSVTGSNFTENVADGSGGAIRATATLRKGFGSLAVMERARISVVNCSFTQNTAVTSQLYDESSVYFQV